jgi:hypothetical protein
MKGINTEEQEKRSITIDLGNNEGCERKEKKRK